MPAPVLKRTRQCSTTGNPLQKQASALYHERSLSLPVDTPLSSSGALRFASPSSTTGPKQEVCSLTSVVAQGVRQGLASATGAPAIKGSHAEACIPPLSTLTRGMEVRFRQLSLTVPNFIDQETSLVPLLAFSEGFVLSELPPSGTRRWSSTGNFQAEDEAGIVAPLLEDDSSELVIGELASSPIEPLTPFGDYVDRAVATSDAPVYDPFVANKSQELHITYPGACTPEFDRLHYASAVLKEMYRREDNQPPPSASLTYKRLAEPMAECVVSYVWKVCTNRIMLPQQVSCYR